MATTATDLPPARARWQFSPLALGFVLLAVGLAALPFSNALADLFRTWSEQPEYSHGILIPFISLFLLWKEREWLASTPFNGAWSGLVVVVMGLAMWMIGELSTIPMVIQYGFLFVLYGLVATLTGWAVFRRLWMPLLILVFMIPLPAFFMNTLSLKLQLISSAIGVKVIRLAGISVFLEGNVIDLGAFQLQVAEACDGLRYLFPLMTLAFILSYFFRGPLWTRVALFLSSMPIAVLMNSARIGAIGITVEYWGVKMAEGLLHDVEGWVVFMFSTAALLGVASLLNRWFGTHKSLRDALDINLAAKTDGVVAGKSATATRRSLSQPFFAAAVLAALASLYALVAPERAEAIPTHRASLVEFPTRLGEWQGRREPLEQVYLDALKLDDYLMANYGSSGNPPVNFYIAYYDSQRKGHSVHSPRSCLPGGGWVMKSFDQQLLTLSGGRTVMANRASIELGRSKQIVYYWFQQRGRQLTNEYAVKWFIFWDALTRNRTDGALVRLTAPVPMNGTEAEADAAIARFASSAIPQLNSYIPD